MVPNVQFHIFTIHYEPPKRRQPLYKGLCDSVLYNGGFTVIVQAIKY